MSKEPKLPRQPNTQKKVASINDPSVAKDLNPIYCTIIEDGIRKEKEYEKVKLLGRGGFGTVFKVIEKGTNQEYAAKVIRKEPLKGVFLTKLKSEIEIHNSLDNCRIVKLQDVFEDNKYVYILLNLCNQETLKEVLVKRKKLHEPEIAYWMKQVLEGIVYLHSCKIIHRDLKLANIFIHNMNVKIGDFGLAARIDQEHKNRMTMCGTPTSMAPEIIAKTGHSYQVDIWAFGVMLYYLKFGITPFNSSTREVVYKRIEKCEFSFPKRPISDTLVKLISALLQKDSSLRPSASEILEYAFFAPNRVPNSLPVEALSKDIDCTMLEFGGSGINDIISIHDNPSESIIASLKMILSKRPAENACIISGSEYNYIVDYLDKTDKYGVLYMLDDGTIAANFNDSTSMFMSNGFYTYFARDMSRLDIEAQKIDSQVHDVNKKCRIINGFCKQLKGGNPEKTGLKTCLVRKFIVREDFNVFLFTDNSLQVFFTGTNPISYFVDPYNMILTILKSSNEKYTCAVDCHKAMLWDPDASQHFSLLDLLLQEFSNKIEMV
ncbi:hypothetical protein ENUP19_0082G0023 [Entamoeba nuttalli]|uniref:Serine/threonine protein kinase, putative n=2 Tax=Entamoeba nuttalli TaxID=412467 RepID=K2H4A9_ENTNP|nr:serine/threonine protein kinase, putative [Entamoeba nuttalli P19]EKE42393.1 serine/threonine protein kinase, putative [Entamoeba nuttalli P19]|eukprot:XP_008855274.1 serine/threonine protein kinase, putative [Entamoeba nuttalli P19]